MKTNHTKTNVLLLSMIAIMTLFVNLSALAQDYGLIHPQSISYFVEQNSTNLYAIKVDSVSVNSTESYYEFYKDWGYNDTTFLTCPDQPIWIGHRCKVLSNGDHIFYNSQDEELLIRSKAQPGETWELFEFSDGSTVQASLISITEETVLTMIDSIKTIGLQLLDSNGMAINSQINNMTISFGKSIGLITMIEAFNFPDTLRQLYLDGESDYGIGNYSFTWEDIYDFQVDDEFQYTYMYTNQSYGDYKFILLKVLDRIDYPFGDSVSYSFERKTYEIDFSTVILTPDSSTLQISNYNETYAFIADSILLPNEAITTFRPYTDNLQYSLCYSPDFNNRRLLTGGGDIYELLQSPQFGACLSMFESNSISNKYAEGIGLVSSHISYFDGPFVMHDLFYYKKGAETFGTPLAIDEVKPDFMDLITFYPNPATDHLNIEGLRSGDIVRLHSILGREIKVVPASENQIQISLNGLSEGIYFLQVRRGDQVQVFKVLKE